MFDKPKIQDRVIIDCLQKNYALQIKQTTFLPLGADRNTAVYRADTEDGSAYFVKLRREDFNEMSLMVPKLLRDQGVPHIIAPVATQDGKIWVQVSGFYLSVYPFITGQDAHDAGLSDAHWIEFGEALKGIHATTLSQKIISRIPKENFSGQWRKRVQQFQQQLEEITFDDPISSALADLLKQQGAVVDALVRRAEHLSRVLQKKLPPFVLCHADIHAW